MALLLCIASGVYSQERNKIREIGLHFTGLESFGIQYKVGNEKSLFRVTALSLLSTNLTYEIEELSMSQSANASGIGLKFGIERPVAIDEKLHFYYGGELQSNIAIQKTETSGEEDERSHNIQWGLGCIIGFSFNLSTNLYLSAEIVPSLSFISTHLGEGSITGYRFSANNHNAGLTIGYRF